VELQVRISKLQQELEKVDDESIISALETILSLFQKANPELEDGAGFSLKGDPIMKDELQKSVKEASERVKSGDFISQEQMEKDLESW
jgi:wyosine [tRNA(Phe)-imidazoG37] synthetase (radical SAM superfamily)